MYPVETEWGRERCELPPSTWEEISAEAPGAGARARRLAVHSWSSLRTWVLACRPSALSTRLGGEGLSLEAFQGKPWALRGVRLRAWGQSPPPATTRSWIRGHSLQGSSRCSLCHRERIPSANLPELPVQKAPKTVPLSSPYAGWKTNRHTPLFWASGPAVPRSLRPRVEPRLPRTPLQTLGCEMTRAFQTGSQQIFHFFILSLLMKMVCQFWGRESGLKQMPTGQNGLLNCALHHTLYYINVEWRCSRCMFFSLTKTSLTQRPCIFRNNAHKSKQSSLGPREGLTHAAPQQIWIWITSCWEIWGCSSYFQFLPLPPCSAKVLPIFISMDPWSPSSQSLACQSQLRVFTFRM